MKIKNITKFLVFLFLVVGSSANGQDLLDKLNTEFPDNNPFEIATFKTTRLGLGHSTETRKKGALQLSVYFRFWDTPNAQSQSFLADETNTRYGLEYAFTDNFTFGFGYSDFDKITDGFFKYKLLKQKRDSKKHFASITLVQTLTQKSTLNANANLYQPSSSSNTYAFASQVLVARKFNSNLSLQISPTFIHREQSALTNDPNNQFAIGFGGRHKIGKHASVVSEYYYVANRIKSFTTHNAFMFGINWEVSDLMLQFHLTNARNFAEDTFITQTTNNFNFKDPNLHFGFNATYIIHTRKKKFK